MSNILLAFLVLGTLSGAGLYIFCPCLLGLGDRAPVPTVDAFAWWGEGPAPAGAEKHPIVPKPFKIHVEEADLEDLKERLAVTRYSEPLEDSQFNYGFPADQLRKVVDYWSKSYDWRKHEAALNKFDHFKAKIEGIDVHYIHAKPTSTKGVKVLPLMLIHGWPGSIVEFLKVIPLLTTPKDGYVFEVICPSIPGYGYSEAPHKKGFNGAETARIFNKLMTHFHRQYYVQGGDWGAFIAQNMAILYPDNVRGLHVNLIGFPKKGHLTLAKMLLGAVAPSLLLTEDEKKNDFFSFKNTFGRLMLESGYMHLQATKPDTIGAALSDSPAGLAAYILEKFSTWTKDEYKQLPDGGLTKKFTLDELLTNVMVYWTTGSITSSQRYYKENLNPTFMDKGFSDALITVPGGISNFPDELLVLPRSFVNQRFQNLLTFTHPARGGHFAAFEEPALLDSEFRHFVTINEQQLVKGQDKKESKAKK